MLMTRKELLGILATGTVTGCATLPTAEQVTLVAKGIGGSVGLLLNECRLPEVSWTVLVAVVKTAVGLTPETGKTLTYLWTTAAKAHVAALVAAGTLPVLTAAVVLVAFALVVRAFELLEERHPVLKTAVTLLGAAVDGFGAGFLATFAPQGLAVQSYDDATYRTLAASAEAAALRQVVRASVAAEGAK